MGNETRKLKQVYNITRFAYYKKIEKNKKGWHVFRERFTHSPTMYSYGMTLKKGLKTIKIEPLITQSKRRLFTISYNDIETKESFWFTNKDFSFVQANITQIMYKN